MSLVTQSFLFSLTLGHSQEFLWNGDTFLSVTAVFSQEFPDSIFTVRSMFS